MRARSPRVGIEVLCGAVLVLSACTAAPTGEPKPAAGGSLLERSVVLLQAKSHAEDPVLRANCIEALQPSRDPRVPAVIEQGLQDPVWIVRFAAAMAAGKRKETALRPALERAAVSDSNDSVRVAAVYALRRMGDTANMNLLAKTLGSKDPAVRANSAFVLGQMGDASAIPLLESHASEEDPRVKFEITAALARLGEPHAQQIVSSLAISKFAEDQWNAMAVCPDLPPDLAANALMLGLQRPSSTPADVADLTTRRQLVAARSLGKMHSAQGAKVAIENLKNPNPSLRALAALALGEILVPKEEGGLAALLDDGDPGVQLAAAAAIVNIESRSAAGQ